MKKNLPEKLRVGMSEAAATMTSILHQLDDDSATDSLLGQYLEASENLHHAISRRKYLLGECKMRREMLVATREQITQQIKSMDRLADRINSSTAEIIMANPDVVFRDDLGAKVYMAKNAKSSLNLKVDTAKTTISNVVNQATAQELGYYAREVTTYVVDTDKLRKDLDEGIVVDFATTSTGYHLRGM